MEATLSPLETLTAVLCDPDGKCCIVGSDEDRRLVDGALASLAAAQSVPKGGAVSAIADALRMAIRQNSHDMLMTGEEIRQCEQALAASAPTVGALRHQIENAIASTGHSTHAPVDAAELADTIANALATQEPSAASEPVATEFPHEEIDAVNAARYKIVDSETSVFGGKAITVGDGTQQVYHGRNGDCRAVAAQLRRAFADGAFWMHGRCAAPPTPPSAPAGAGEGENAKHFERMFLSACESLGEISAALGIPEDEAEAANGNELILEALRALRADPMPVVTAAKRLLALYEDMRGEREEDEVFINLRAAVEAAEAAPPSHEGEDARDAARYRWLREQHWHTAPLCVVTNPKNAVKLGYFCPSDERLDAMVDAARAGGSQ